MEKAVIVPNEANNIDNLSSYERVYVGSEFCQNLLPYSRKLYELAKCCRDHDIRVSLMLPPVTQRGVKSAISVMNTFYDVISEVVVNDYGLLEMIKGRYPNLDMVIGRMISHTIFPISNQTRAQSSELLKYLMDYYGVKRIEVDERNSQIMVDVPREYQRKLSLSLYFPYVVAAMTRRCVFPNLFTNDMKKFEDFKCNQECLKIDNRLKLKNSAVKEEIYLYGNAHFVKRTTMSKNLEKYCIDRVVYDDLYIDKNS